MIYQLCITINSIITITVLITEVRVRTRKT